MLWISGKEVALFVENASHQSERPGDLRRIDTEGVTIMARGTVSPRVVSSRNAEASGRRDRNSAALHLCSRYHTYPLVSPGSPQHFPGAPVRSKGCNRL